MASEPTPPTAERSGRPTDRNAPPLVLPTVLATTGAALWWDGTRVYAAALLVLMTLVALHEAGHLVAARLCGVGAPEFAVGFGPVLWRSRRPDRHGTSFVVRAVPVGGYVQIDGLSNDLESDEAPVPGKRSYDDVSASRQILIAVAGPAANLVVAFVLLAGVVASFGVERPTLSITPLPGSPADTAGFRPGDRLVSVDGVVVDGWAHARGVLADADPDRPTRFVIDRDGAELPLDVAARADGQAFGFRAQTEREHLAPLPAVTTSAHATVLLTANSVKGVAGIAEALVYTPAHLAGVSENSSENRLLSPIGAAQVAEQSAGEFGAAGPVLLVAGVSVFLAVFNLLPVPPLDGGHVAVAAYEGIASRLRRRPVRVDRSRLAPLTAAVVSVVLVLGVVSLVLDVLRPVQLAS